MQRSRLLVTVRAEHGLRQVTGSLIMTLGRINMTAYIREIAANLLSSNDGSSVFNHLRALSEELERLDPRDFLPKGQYAFVKLRIKARRWAQKQTYNNHDDPDILRLRAEVDFVLDLYGGIGSNAISRSFTFVSDSDLRSIIERDYRELKLYLFPSQAWKSTVVMSGSILEAILYDRLRRDAATISLASNSNSAPKAKSIEKGAWTLHDLIQVSLELAIIPKDRGSAIDQILRDYRNYVHPLKELRAAHPCTEAEAYLAIGALDAICNHLS